ncbi:hypothetical protein DIURU_005265 [Diutina rugosa]|uniref:catechol O-methyltransferase n=1 Tax=Diutina rugosa TaxID=5481 RepID=A0A642UDS8_DIURU|nr:uncharacterized protein DIURU_005265 [Diutina rugosa]KAA8897288.1 hypothetical protein DIURU_005265 [Diutina rugosa]
MSKPDPDFHKVAQEKAAKCKQYIDSLDQSQLKGNPQAIADAIDDFAQENRIMTIGAAKSEEIRNRLRQSKPKHGAELGVYVGYSALRFAPLVSGTYYSLEVIPEYRDIAQHFIQLAGLTNVKFLLGDSATTLVKLHDELNLSEPSKRSVLDFLLIDHAKELYLPDIRTVETLNLVTVGSVIVADNCKMKYGVPAYLEYIRSTPEARRQFIETEPNPNGYYPGRWNILYENTPVDFGFDAIEVSVVKAYLDG